MKIPAKILKLLEDVREANRLGGRFASLPEGYAALLADVDDLWEDVKRNADICAFAQAERVFGTAVRFVSEFFDMPLEIVARDMLAELERARRRFGVFNSAHEGYAVVLEELEELWEAVRAYRKEGPGFVAAGLRKRIGEEAIQVGAMALRLLSDCYGLEIGEEKDADPPAGDVDVGNLPDRFDPGDRYFPGRGSE